MISIVAPEEFKKKKTEPKSQRALQLKDLCETSQGH